MTSRRTARISQAVLEQVSSTILFGLKDPRVRNVTVTRVEVSGDLRSAKVYVSVMGDEKTQKLCMQGLNSARGFLQSKVGDRLKTRYTPVLKFILDPGVKRSIEASRILREVLADSQETDVAEFAGEPCLSQETSLAERDQDEPLSPGGENRAGEPSHVKNTEQ